jgi:hypothetical protein
MLDCDVKDSDVVSVGVSMRAWLCTRWERAALLLVSGYTSCVPLKLLCYGRVSVLR